MTEPEHFIPIIGIEAHILVILQRCAGVEALGVGHGVLDKVDLHVEVIGHGHLAQVGLLHGFLCRSLDALHGFVGVDGGHAAAAAFVDGHGRSRAIRQCRRYLPYQR